jgi:hypothetical protein
MESGGGRYRWQSGHRLALVAAVMSLMVPGVGTAQAPEPLAFGNSPQGLVFGPLVPGTSDRIDPVTDAARRAEFRVVGRQSEGLVWFEMPAALVHTRGLDFLPLSFRHGDGIHVRALGGASEPFDPAVDQINIRHWGINTETKFYIGGTARPSAGQVGGAYEATITAFIIPDS